jgi:hypothetical protein
VKKRSRNYFKDEQSMLFRAATELYPPRIVPPVTDRENVIRECHDLGHYGYKRTLYVVQQTYYWEGMTQHV